MNAPATRRTCRPPRSVFLLELPAALLAESSVRRPQTAMMTQPVVCRVLQEARGRSGAVLAGVVVAGGPRRQATNSERGTRSPGAAPLDCLRAGGDVPSHR